MKKIILILIALFLTTGCFNYLSLNDIAVVSLIHIDYKDEYIVTVEVRENEKDNPNASNFYTNSGISLDNAFENIGLTLNKALYLVDTDTLIITDNIIKYKLNNTLDYLTRENNIGNNFNILVSNDDINKITKNIKSNNKIVGSYLKESINNPYNNIVDIKYNEFIKDYLNDYKDMILPYGKLDDDKFIIDQAIMFNDDKELIRINNDNVKIYNLLNNIDRYSLFKIKYNEGSLIYRVKSVKSKINYKNDSIEIKLDIVGNFNEIDNINLDKGKINELLDITKNKINSNVNLFINELIVSNIDTLGFKKIIYNKTKNKLDNINNLKYNVLLNVTLEREELTFDNIGDKQNEI